MYNRTNLTQGEVKRIEEIIIFNNELEKFEIKLLNYIDNLALFLKDDITNEEVAYKLANVNLYTLNKVKKYIERNEYIGNSFLTKEQKELYGILLRNIDSSIIESYLEVIDLDLKFKNIKFKNYASLVIFLVNTIIKNSIYFKAEK